MLLIGYCQGFSEGTFWWLLLIRFEAPSNIDRFRFSKYSCPILPGSVAPDNPPVESLGGSRHRTRLARGTLLYSHCLAAQGGYRQSQQVAPGCSALYSASQPAYARWHEVSYCSRADHRRSYGLAMDPEGLRAGDRSGKIHSTCPGQRREKRPIAPNFPTCVNFW